MRFVVRPRQPARLAVVAVIAALALLTTIPAAANVALTRVSTDTFTNTTSQHRTQVEPDTFASGNTIVSAFQTGRFFDGGASGIAVARSGNSGATWTTTVLPGITTFQGGPYDRVSDPAVAFEAQDNAPTGVWMVSSLAIRNNPVRGVAVITSRSTNGGVTWSNPVTTATGSNLDKNWIACDNNSASPFFGNCYTEFDENADGNRIKMSTSTNGGLNWGAKLNTGDSATGLGGQPVVRPNGTVLVPIANANETQIRSFRSINGGASCHCRRPRSTRPAPPTSSGRTAASDRTAAPTTSS
jgi:hypothetical protein